MAVNRVTQMVRLKSLDPRKPRGKSIAQNEEEGVVLNCELVGLRNLKISHNWRIELDTYEIEQEKVKDLVDLIQKPVVIAIIPSE